MRLLALVLAAGLVLAGCTTAREPGRDLAILHDAQVCEEMAERQIQEARAPDHAIRLAIFESCMALHGWQGR